MTSELTSGAGKPALSGVRVLDLSRLLPGGYATMLMGDMGADVVKVEEPKRGDYLRWMPPLTSTGEGAMHVALGRGKRSVSCNLRSDEGREVFLGLARRADVVVESFRPGVLDRLGVGYERLRELNPGIVYAAISGYGKEGPYAAKAGHDINYLGYSGALSFSGTRANGPHQPGLQIGDLAGGMAAVIAVLSALRVRDATGEGQFCDVSMTDVVMSWLTAHAAGFSATGVPPAPGAEMLNGGFACYRVYACAGGGYVTVGALEPQFFAGLLEGLGLPEKLRAAHLDPERQDELAGRIAGAFATRSRDEWMDVFADRDACVGPVQDVGEALNDPNARARGMVADEVRPDGTRWSRIGPMPGLTQGTPPPGGPPSALGADTDDLLVEMGLSSEEVAALRDSGAV